jgi:cellulose synthase/poly-beta-1,6-N-acetylglucosamine synthase-like glycosyltransferase
MLKRMYKGIDNKTANFLNKRIISKFPENKKEKYSLIIIYLYFIMYYVIVFPILNVYVTLWQRINGISLISDSIGIIIASCVFFYIAFFGICVHMELVKIIKNEI